MAQNNGKGLVISAQGTKRLEDTAKSIENEFGVNIISRAKAIASSQVSCLNQRGTAFDQDSNYVSALKDLIKAQENYQRAIQLHEQGKTEESRMTYLKARKLDSTLGMASSDTADLSLKLGIPLTVYLAPPRLKI